MEEEQKLFKKSSTTYYLASKFFPKKVRDDVYRLYSFVRVADDYVDEKPQQPKKLLALEKSYESAVADHAFDATSHKWDELEVRVIKNIVRLQHKYKFERKWIEAFLKSMKSDIDPKEFKTLDDSLEYVHGSAEVIGLMMAKIMHLSAEATDAAKAQGRAMQWINFIRDIDEDNKLGRCYFPKSDLKKFGLKDLSEATAKENREQFKKFIQFQLDRYAKWQAEAYEGIHFIPERLRVPVKTAIDMYNWTARKIEKDPFIVFSTKIKPRKSQVIRKIIRNTVKGTARGTVKTTKKARAKAKRAVPKAKEKLPEIKQNVAEKAAEKTQEVIEKTEEVRSKLPGSQDKDK